MQGKLEGGDDFFGVPGGLYFGEYFGHDSIFVDDERGSFDAHIFFAVHGFFDPDATGFGECVICICKQIKGEGKLVGKLAVRFYAVGRDTNDLCVGDGGELFLESTGFDGAAACVIFGIKIDDCFLSG